MPPIKLASLNLAASVALVLFIASCGTEQSDVIGVSVDQIAEDPEAYYGSRVTVSGEVSDVYNPTTFSIGGEEFEEELLVLSLDTIAAVAGRSGAEPVRRDDIVQITGTVRQFISGDFSDEFGIDLGPVDDEFEDRPVLVARRGSAQLPSVVVTPRGGSVAPPTEEQLVTDFATAAGPDGREVARQPARLRGVDVAMTVGDRSFWATREDADSLFVVITSGALDGAHEGASVDTDQTWDLYGILREVPPAAELAAAWDLDEETISRLENEPVFLQAIYAVPTDGRTR